MNEQDAVAQFVQDRCEIGSSYGETIEALYASYRWWAKENSRFPKSKKSFGNRLADLGYKPERAGDTAGTRIRVGLRLRSDETSQNFRPAGSRIKGRGRGRKEQNDGTGASDGSDA
jgi:phage/plasmid-associated DNA primase